MDINIRIEKQEDYESVEKVTEEAFKNAEHTDGNEHVLVKKLRNSDAFIQELSLVAEENKNIIGHLMMTEANICSGDKKVKTLALAPVSVLPKYQGKGIGKKLIGIALETARKLGYKSVIVLGHDKYYPKFGFKPASIYEIRAPFPVPDEAFMAIELIDGSLINVNGTIEYAREFME